MEIKQANFIISVADYKECTNTVIPELAIAGKSNVGKSSLINMLTNNSKLAKTSSTPGRTRLINYFNINKDSFYLVDLPGYGFAKVSDEERTKWAILIEGYFSISTMLKHVLVLVDCRHEPNDNDMQLVAFLHHCNISFTIVATKADKLSKLQLAKQMKVIADKFRIAMGNIYAVSSDSRQGKDELLERIAQTVLE